MAAPEGILWANEQLISHPNRPLSYRFAGCQGDSNHSFGYHLSKNQLNGKWDYSLQLALDIEGGNKYPDYASAWDLSFNPSDMKLVTGRLLKAAQTHDPRMKPCREFCGTINGTQTYPWDVTTDSSEGIGSWDDSHLWHVHISILRWFCDGKNALLGIVEIVCGVPLSKTKVVGIIESPIPAKNVPFPLKVGRYFSIKTHNKAPGVKILQLRLQQLGYAPKAASWADGVYGQATSDAVAAYKRDHHMSFPRRCGRPTWKSLFASQKGK